MRIPKHNQILPDLPFHGSPPHPDALKALRAKIRTIEQGQTPFSGNDANWLSPDQNTAFPHRPTSQSVKKPETEKNSWNFAIDEIDENLPENKLNPATLHEIKPATYQDSHAALGFALALAGRRLSETPGSGLLWCLPPMMSGEFGEPYGPGLRHLIPKPENCLITEPRTHAHFLWAMEEGLSAGGDMAISSGTGTSAGTSPDINVDASVGTSPFALVLGMTKTVEPTPARRLSLRAGHHRTPGLLLTHHDSPGINMAETRWRIARAESQSPTHLTSAPGKAKWKITLERAPGGKADLKWILEWHHETHSFTLVTPLVDRAPQTMRTGCSSR